MCVCETHTLYTKKMLFKLMKIRHIWVENEIKRRKGRRPQNVKQTEKECVCMCKSYMQYDRTQTERRSWGRSWAPKCRKKKNRVKDVKTKAYIIIRYRYNKKQWCAMLNTLHMVKVYYFPPIRKWIGIIDNAISEYTQTNTNTFTYSMEMEIQHHRYKTYCLFGGS